MKLNTLKLNKILEERGLNQTWIAIELKVSRQLVSRWFVKPESVKLKTIATLGNLLDIDPKELIGY